MLLNNLSIIILLYFTVYNYPANYSKLCTIVYLFVCPFFFSRLFILFSYIDIYHAIAARYSLFTSHRVLCLSHSLFTMLSGGLSSYLLAIY